MTKREITKLNERAKTLTIRYTALMSLEQTPIIKDIIKEYFDEVDRLYKIINTKREYTFNFTGGGWNSVYAYTIEEAKQLAVQEYGNSGSLTPDTKTFRELDEANYSNLLSTFN